MRRPPLPKRSLFALAIPCATRIEWTRFLSAVRCLTRCRRKRARSRSALLAGSGSQISGTRSRRASSASTQASILSVLQAKGASPFALTASAIRTSQPSRSSRSWTKRAPFIDSITASTSASPSRCTSPASPSASGATAPRSTSSPPPRRASKSRRLRLRSNPTYNMRGPPIVSLRTRGVCLRGRPSFITFASRSLTLGRAFRARLAGGHGSASAWTLVCSAASRAAGEARDSKLELNHDEPLIGQLADGVCGAFPRVPGGFDAAVGHLVGAEGRRLVDRDAAELELRRDGQRRRKVACEQPGLEAVPRCVRALDRLVDRVDGVDRD